MKDHRKLLIADEKEKIEQIKAFIDANLSDELRILKISKRFSISKNTLQRQFAIIYESSVGDYIQQCRMNLAMQLLRSHTLSVGQIYFAIGYKDRSSFTRAFSKYFGHPPMYYFIEN